MIFMPKMSLRPVFRPGPRPGLLKTLPPGDPSVDLGSGRGMGGQERENKGNKKMHGSR